MENIANLPQPVIYPDPGGL